jgi:hypothetical protein
LNILELKKMRFQFKAPLSVFIVLFLLLTHSPSVAGGDLLSLKTRELKYENSLLETELRLASKKTSYIILDLGTESASLPARMSLKNRGVILRAFDIERINYRSARGWSTAPLPLNKKKAFLPPKRKEIRPHKPEDGLDDVSPLDFLELKDMPSSYTLQFGEGLYISITGQPKGLIPSLIHRVRSIFIHLGCSLTMVWSRVWNHPFAAVDITMSKEDAQALYWSLEEGADIVVIKRHPYDRV